MVHFAYGSVLSFFYYQTACQLDSYFETRFWWYAYQILLEPNSNNGFKYYCYFVGSDAVIYALLYFFY